MNNLPLGICLSIYPGLRNTCAELPKVECSSCFKILRIRFKITRKTQEIAFQGFPISKFSRGSMSPDPPLSPPTSMPWRRHCTIHYIQKLRRCDLAYYLPIFCLKIEIDCASFASRQRLFQSFAPLYLKLFFRNSVLGLGKAISVSVLLKI